MLDILEETVQRLPETARKVACLGTRSTLEAGVYQKGLAARGVEHLFHEEWQRDVDALIAGVKAGEATDRLARGRQELAARIEAEATDAIVVTCTDPAPSADCTAGIPCTDSSRALAEATVQKWLASRT